jgi:hypothetical protein
MHLDVRISAKFEMNIPNSSPLAINFQQLWTTLSNRTKTSKPLTLLLLWSMDSCGELGCWILKIPSVNSGCRFDSCSEQINLAVPGFFLLGKQAKDLASYQAVEVKCACTNRLSEGAGRFLLRAKLYGRLKLIILNQLRRTHAKLNLLTGAHLWEGVVTYEWNCFNSSPYGKISPPTEGF